jgi:hypothetical protein
MPRSVPWEVLRSPGWANSGAFLFVFFFCAAGFERKSPRSGFPSEARVVRWDKQRRIFFFGAGLAGFKSAGVLHFRNPHI